MIKKLHFNQCPNLTENVFPWEYKYGQPLGHQNNFRGKFVHYVGLLSYEILCIKLISEKKTRFSRLKNNQHAFLLFIVEKIKIFFKLFFKVRKKESASQQQKYAKHNYEKMKMDVDAVKSGNLRLKRQQKNSELKNLSCMTVYLTRQIFMRPVAENLP